MVEAPRVQYALLDTPAALNCSVSINGTVSITWTGPDDSSHSGMINNVQLHHEGEYRCDVFISDKDLTMKKPVNFTVIGKLAR